MEKDPLVSVIIATYNMGKYIGEAVESVLGQNYERVEVIVVDDGSTDNTDEEIKRFTDDVRVIVLRQENAGQAAAKNRGIAASNGELIGFCDADDRWLRHKLCRQVSELVSRPNVGVVYSDRVVIDAEGNKILQDGPKRYSGRVTERLLVENFIPFSTAIVRRRVLEEVGGFDERLRMSIDCDLWLRISLSYEFYYVPEQLIEYRVWSGQMSKRMGERLEDFFRLMERFLYEHPAAVSRRDARRAFAHTHTTMGIWLANEGRKKEAWRAFGRAATIWPGDIRLLKCIAKLALGW